MYVGMRHNRPLPRGIYAPLPCFFDEKEEIDFNAYKKHVQFVARGGAIPVVSAALGESPHLNHTERQNLVLVARQALDEIDLEHVPLITGVGVHSTRESTQLAQEAASAGADFVLVAAPGVYEEQLLSDVTQIKNYFVGIANASPVPIIIHNSPRTSGGIDLTSELIIECAKATPNIYGALLNCANIGKLTRITATVDQPLFRETYPRRDASTSFLVIDGFIDMLLPSIASNSAGACTGLANLAPRTCEKLWELCQNHAAATHSETRNLHNLISSADGVVSKTGIPGMKMIMQRLFGYGSRPRHPIMAMSRRKGEDLMAESSIKQLLEYEEKLTNREKRFSFFSSWSSSSSNGDA